MPTRWRNNKDLEQEKVYNTLALISLMKLNTPQWSTFRLIFFINGADPRCKFCNTSLKTIDHLISGYFIIALNEYTNRHNQAGQYIHWKIRNHYDTETHNKWYDHERLPVVDTPKVTFSGNSQLELTEKCKLTGQIQYLNINGTNRVNWYIRACHQIAIIVLKRFKNLANIKILKLKLLRCGKWKQKPHQLL